MPLTTEPPQREAGGYQYRDDRLDIIHNTSAPLTDAEALEYFAVVQSWFPGCKVQYIERREMYKYVFEMMDYQYVDGEVVPL